MDPVNRESNALRNIIVAVCWVGLIVGLAAAWKFWWVPRQHASTEAATSSASAYKETITLNADAFSGYAVLRSPAMAKLLKAQGIKLEVVDDGANYANRMQALKQGDAQMAVFTLDSFLKSGITLGGEFPATIVAIVDQSNGADGIVAYQTGLGKLQDLDDANARIWLLPDSPSEFIARIVVGSLTLPNLPEEGWMQAVGSQQDVLAKLRATDPKARAAFALWEPYLSEALKVPSVHRLFDSGQCTNCVLDIIVSRREFLKDHPDAAHAAVEAYFRALYSFTSKPDGMVQLLIEDGKADHVTPEQAKQLVAGIQWKNVLENYGHFDLDASAAGVQTLDVLLDYVGKVLLQTHAIPAYPYKGQANRLYYDGILRKLKDSGFHPGKQADLVQGFGPGVKDLEPARAAATLPALDDAGWGKLIPVGTAKVAPIGFRRGTSDISELSRGDLDALAQNLGQWSQFYVRIVGHARAEGDAAANAALARDRATAVVQYLAAQG
ncbi:OmpA family protein, partial [Candidatus Uhrbacteria bacterium]|nr:OmpA family protein [Candidatus Uhrbacteria bacterium]